MLTVGDILKRARAEKKLTLEDGEKQLRIRKKYLAALEANAWDDLPSLPYIKGFLHNYSKYLGLKPEEMLAFFRRQFHEKEKERLLPTGLTAGDREPLFRITPQIAMIMVVASFLGVFFSYLFFQYRNLTNPPPVTIEKPLEGEIVQSTTLTVIGKTDADAVVSVNNQQIALSDTGTFSATISLNPGVNTVTVEATSKQGKKRAVTRTIQADY